jgi:hypothetical protein
MSFVYAGELKVSIYRTIKYISNKSIDELQFATQFSQKITWK